MANEMRDRLVELLSDIPCNAESCSAVCDGRCQEFDDLDRCQIYRLADHLTENGVVVPPCSLHQTLWEITWNKRIEQCKVSSLTQKADGSFKIRLTNLIHKFVFEITPDKIGKTVFLTKSQAEEALKNEQEKL